MNEKKLDKKILDYITLIEKWNSKLGLISYKDKNELLVKHIMDALSVEEILKFKADDNLIVDLGTGCGLPGIPLSIVYSDKRFYLVESRRKYIMFLKKTVEELELNNVKIFYNRLENIEEMKGKVDIILCRAVGSIENVIKSSKDALKKGGRIIMYKGKKVFEEIEQYKNFIKDSGFKVEGVYESLYMKEYGISHYFLEVVR